MPRHAQEKATVKRTIPVTAIRENVPVMALAGIAFGASYGHIVRLCGEYGPHGWVQYATAGCVDLLCIIGAEERQRDKRISRPRAGKWVSWPTLVLITGIALTLAANMATAQRNPLGYFVSALPAGALAARGVGTGAPGVLRCARRYRYRTPPEPARWYRTGPGHDRAGTGSRRDVSTRQGGGRGGAAAVDRRGSHRRVPAPVGRARRDGRPAVPGAVRDGTQAVVPRRRRQAPRDRGAEGRPRRDGRIRRRGCGGGPVSTRQPGKSPPVASRPGVAAAIWPLPRGRGSALSRGAVPRASRTDASRTRDFTPIEQRCVPC